MFLLSAQNNFYVIMNEFICRRACEKKSSLSFMSPKSVVQDFKSFLGINNSLKPPFLDFVIVFHLVLKNQET